MSAIRIMWLLLFLCIGVTTAFDWDEVTPLDSYVNFDDGAYHWEVVDEVQDVDHSWGYLNLTSQIWTDETYVREYIWHHDLTVYIPATPRAQFSSAAMLYIHGGNNNQDPITHLGDSRERRCKDFAVNVGAVCAILRQVPNQPIHFIDSPLKPRTEDFIIAKTWVDYIEYNGTGSPDPYTNALLAMAKAARKAMDAVSEYTPTVDPSIVITDFMPTGYSKRGWTAWLAACTDPRVFAVVPVVLDQLNFLPSLAHHFRAYGGWSWAFLPYWQEGVARYLHHERAEEIGNQVAIDPFAFNERLTMPKLVMSASGDEFFLPDDTYYYWDQLTSPKWFNTFENDHHSLSDHTDIIWQNYEAFFIAHRGGYSLPNVSWIRRQLGLQNSAEVVATVSRTPRQVVGWMTDTTAVVCEEMETYSKCRRDFRQEQLAIPTDTGILWAEVPVEHLVNNQYRLMFPAREDDGFRGFFLQMIFDGPEGRTFQVSSEIQIIPDILPYPDCTTEEECQGHLV